MKRLSRDRGSLVGMHADAAGTAAALTALSGLHFAWGCGAPFPFRDRRRLADTVAGTTAMPPARDCFAVAGALVVAGGLVGDLAPMPLRMRRIGVVGVASVFAGRGIAGLTGRTRRLVPWTPSERFQRLDARYYGPLCLVLAAGALASLRS